MQSDLRCAHRLPRWVRLTIPSGHVNGALSGRCSQVRSPCRSAVPGPARFVSSAPALQRSGHTADVCGANPPGLLPGLTQFQGCADGQGWSMLCRTQNETARRSFDAGLPAALRSGMQSPVQIAIAVPPSLCVDAPRCTAAAHCARIDFTKTTLSALKWRAQPSLSCPGVRGASASGECVLGDGGSPWNETAWKSM
jgi:hypothetical protein